MIFRPVKCTYEQFLERVEEKTMPITGMYLGESGKIYFITDNFENSIENSNKILYNINIQKNEIKN